MVRFFLLPVRPGSSTGYEIMVAQDIERLQTIESDEFFFAKRRSVLGRFYNIISLKPSAFKIVAPKIERNEFLFVGDSVLTPFVPRSVLNRKETTIRFHNLYLRSLYQYGFLQLLNMVGLRSMVVFLSVAFVEHFALRQKKAKFDFVSFEDEQFARERFQLSDTEVHGVNVPVPQMRSRLLHSERLIFFGSLGAHQRPGVDNFVRVILPILRQKDSGYHLEMFGRGTERFHDPENGVYGHGFYNGTGLPFDGDGIFVVPDTIGLGVKMKIGCLVSKGAHVVSTPLGVIGYPKAVTESLHVADLPDWINVIPLIKETNPSEKLS